MACSVRWLASVFQRYPADVVAWAAQHRDGALMTALQNAVETGAIEKKAFDTAREMLKDSIPVEAIAKYTRLSEEQVRAL